MHRIGRNAPNLAYMYFRKQICVLFVTHVMRMPHVPTCNICTDRFRVPSGHIACAVCTAQLEERGSLCHICREVFTSSAKLFY